MMIGIVVVTMTRMVLPAYAKITLSLDIIRKLADGYHEIQSVMQQLTLSDTITIKEKVSGISITSNHSGLPLDQRNLAWKAANLLVTNYCIDKGVEIHINKVIPIESGLAGGSADAACVLKGLNDIWRLGLTKGELIALGTEIGYDVCYCIHGGTALVTGKGEIISPLLSALRLPIVLAYPGFGVSTKDSYKGVNLNKIGHAKSSEKMAHEISISNIEGVVRNLHNDFEFSVLGDHPQIGSLKDKIESLGALGVLLSGSGSSVFGITDSINQAMSIAKHLASEGIYAWSGWTFAGS